MVWKLLKNLVFGCQAFQYLKDLDDGSMEDILRNALSKFKVLDSQLIQRAANFASETDEGKELLDGCPVNHYLMGTTILLASSSNSEAVVASGLLLHDSLYDREVTYTEYVILQVWFGIEVAKLVRDVSKLSKLSKICREGKLQNPERMPDLILATVVDARAVAIKIAERIVQLIALDTLKPEKKQSFVDETLCTYVPLAGRLCFNLWKNQLDILCIPASEELKELYANTASEDDVKAFENELRRKLEKEKLTGCVVTSRKKSLASIRSKISVCQDRRWENSDDKPSNHSVLRLRDRTFKHLSSEKENKEKSLDSIFPKLTDIIGLRIIVNTEDECYKAKDVVESLWKKTEGLENDYIHKPHPNGYRSLHIIVMNENNQYMEVQIRTKEMHEQADGNHCFYKEGNSQVPKHVKMWVEFARLVNKQAKGQTTAFTNSSSHRRKCPYRKIDERPCSKEDGVCRFPGKGFVYVIVKAKNEMTIEEYSTGTLLRNLCEKKGLIKVQSKIIFSKKELERQLKGQVFVNEARGHPHHTLKSGDIIKFVCESFDI